MLARYVAEEERHGRLLLGAGQRGEAGRVVEQHHPLPVTGEQRLEVPPDRAGRQQSQDADLREGRTGLFYMTRPLTTFENIQSKIQ